MVTYTPKLQIQEVIHIRAFKADSKNPDIAAKNLHYFVYITLFI